VLGFQNHAAPIGNRLYLPEAWINDEKRCIEAGIPQEHIEFHRKHDLALQLVIQARLQGIAFGWVGADSFYGEDPKGLSLYSIVLRANPTSASFTVSESQW